MTQPIKAYLSTCVWRDIDAPTVMAVLSCLRRQDVEFTWGVSQGDSLISRSRSEQATKFLLTPALGEVLLFVDSDIIFTDEDAVQLVTDCANGYSVIGGFYVTRNAQLPRPAVRLKVATPALNLGEKGQKPVEIIYASTGFMAIHRKVLEDIAKDLPLCHTGDKSEMYPFFVAGPYKHKEGSGTGYGWEFLSEDWNASQLARDKGYKIWLQPSILLGHMGFRSYWAHDVRIDPIGTTYVVVTEGEQDRTGVLSDLSSYYQISKHELISMLKDKDFRLALEEEWKTVVPKTSAEVASFYSTTENSIMAYAQTQVTPTYWDRMRLALEAIGKVVEFGGGIGTLSIHLGTRGRHMTYVELPSLHKKFAEHRFKSAGVPIRVVDGLDRIAGPIDSFLCVDVLEYMAPEDMKTAIAKMYSIVCKGGSLIFITEQSRNPMQLSSAEEVVDVLKAAGFSGGPIRWRKE